MAVVTQGMHCWLFWLQAFPHHRTDSQPEAPGGSHAHVQLSSIEVSKLEPLWELAQAMGGTWDSCFLGILAFGPTQSSSGFWWLTLGSHSLKYRLNSALSSSIKNPVGHKSEMVPWPSDRCLYHLFHFPWDGWISSGPLHAATSVGDALPPRLPRLWQRMEAHELVSLFKGS